MDAREIIIRPVITEHSYDGMEYGVYTFEVAKEANKIEIAKAVEELFKVKVTKVNVINVKPKPKRYRYTQKGYTKGWKKAMVTVAEGQSIDLFS